MSDLETPPEVALDQYRQRILSGETVTPEELAAGIEALRRTRSVVQEGSTAKTTNSQKAKSDAAFDLLAGLGEKK